MEANAVCMVQTVEGNKVGFTKKEIMRAELAKNPYEMIVFPSVDDCKLSIQSNGIGNCPITLQDIKNAQIIHGQCLGTATLKGKSTRGKMRIAIQDHLEIPKEFKMRNENVALCADIMFILGVPFLITISKKLKFITILPIASRSNDNLLEAFDQTFRVYNYDGFTIATLHVDPEFKLSEDAMIDDHISVDMCCSSTTCS